MGKVWNSTLNRNTPLPKPTKPIAKSSKPIAKVSKNRKAALETYRRRRDKFLEGKTCEFPGCTSKKVTLHHKRGRVGAFLTDKRWFCALCASHHRWVEEHPLEAKKLNLSDSRLSKL